MATSRQNESKTSLSRAPVCLGSGALLVLLVLLATIITTEAMPSHSADCMKNPFASACRGISAKRSIGGAVDIGEQVLPELADVSSSPSGRVTSEMEESNQSQHHKYTDATRDVFMKHKKFQMALDNLNKAADQLAYQVVSASDDVLLQMMTGSRRLTHSSRPNRID